jgi:tetratricopeptide (TPR) repeat protein
VKRAVGADRAARTLRRLGEAAEAFEHDRFDDARRVLTPLAREAPEVAEIRELHGLTLYRMGKWAPAAAELEAFREMSGSAEQHPPLMDCYRALGRMADVDDLYEELKQVSPSAPIVTEGRIVVAGCHADRGDVQGAIRILEQGWRMPKLPAIHHLRRAYALADMYERTGQAVKARELFRWVAGHDRDFADVRQRVHQLG